MSEPRTTPAVDPPQPPRTRRREAAIVAQYIHELAGDLAESGTGWADARNGN